MARVEKVKPDPKLVQDQLETLQNLFKIWKAPAFMRYFVFIQTKKNSKIATATKQKLNTRIIPFQYNDIQLHIEDHIGQYNICLKPRQVGLTTWFLMRRIFVPSIITTGTNGFLISQSGQKATEHFSMVKRALKYVGANDLQDMSKNDLTIALQQNLLHTTYSNRKEIIFDQLGNTIQIGSAEVEEAGQGSTLHHVVASEVARWPGNPEETLANLKEAITLDGTLDMESTANGAGGYFYEEFFRAERHESEFTAHFHPWWFQREYRLPLTEKQEEEMRADLASDEQKLIDTYKLDLQQIAFRRAKKKSLRHNFDEKYPEDPITCLDAATCVLLENGRTKRIDQIVKEKYSGRVMSLDARGKIVPKRVINWYRSPRNGRRTYKLTFENAPGTCKGQVGAILTEEHLVLTEKGYRRVDSIDGEIINTGTPAPGPRAFQVILGSLLGDGHIGDCALSVSQVTPDYLKLKAQVLNGMGGRVKKNTFEGGLCKDGHSRKQVYSMNTDIAPYFRWLRKIWYPEGVKIFPLHFVRSLDNLGLAIWFMDDGLHHDVLNQPGRYIAKYRDTDAMSYGGLATGLIDKENAGDVAEILCDMGFDCYAPIDTKYSCIRFSTIGFRNFCNAIGEYVTPEFRYKLAKDSPSFNPKHYRPEGVKTFWDRAIVKETKPKMQKGGAYEKGPYYCIDVEDTHNFVTLGGVVHNCFLIQGIGFFDKEVLRARYLELEAYKPLQSRGGGVLKIFFRRIPGRQYCIGADPAAGRAVTSEKSDFSSAVVLDVDTGEQQAAYQARLAPEDFGLDLVDLGRLYNNAVIAVERGVAADSGGDGGTVISTIKNEKYMQLYKHKEHWKDRRKRATGSFTLQDGLPMSGRTRPVALNKLKYIVDNFPELIHDKELVKQCLVFVRDEKGHPAASPGNHDDAVLANAIAQLARQALLGNYDPLLGRAEKYGETPAEEREDEEED